MNRRWRRLLVSGLTGAAISALMGRGRKRGRTTGRSTFMALMSPFVPSLVGEMGKESIWRRLLPLRRRVK